MSPEAVVAGVVAVYMTLLLILGWAASTLTKSPEDFFLAGRSLGAWVTAVSSTASSESGWVVLGAVGMAYAGGVSALWYAPGCLCGYVVNLYLVAPRLRREAAVRGSLTLPDFLADFAGGSRTVRLLSVAVIFLCLGAYVAAQLTATGKAMEAILGLPYGQGVALGGGVILLYTLLGGFRAVSWTDFVQGLIMAAALTAMPLLALAGAGGYGAVLQGLERLDPALVSVTGGKTGFALFGLITGLFGIGLGYPGQPHVLTRYMAASSGEKIRRTQLIAMVWGVVVFYGAGYLGLAGRLLRPGLSDPEQLFPLLAKESLHPLLAGVMLAAILSAIMSTVSSQLLVAASAVSRDLLERGFGIAQSSRASLLAGRAAVVVLGLFAMAVAVGEVRVVFWFVLFAWSGLGAAFGPVVLLSLWTRRVTPWGAAAGIATGFLTTLLWKAAGGSERYIYELVPAFFLSGAAVLIVSALERRLGGTISDPVVP